MVSPQTWYSSSIRYSRIRSSNPCSFLLSISLIIKVLSLNPKPQTQNPLRETHEARGLVPCGIAAGARELQLCCQEEEKVAVASCRVVGFRVFVLGFGIH